MNEVLNINKPIGITSYDVIRGLKKKYPGQKIGHAGTLDPLAEGVLICLVGDEATKRQAEFMDCTKEYEFEVIFGFKTDTYDVLGLIMESNSYDLQEISKKLQDILSKSIFLGPMNQKVPPFSAVKVNGRPLYRWYLDGKINEVEVPTKEIEIHKLEIISSGVHSRENIKKEILDLVSMVKSGFRNEIVYKKWDELLNEKATNVKFLKITLSAVVSKGTYVRAIANDLGEMLGIGACTMKIKRTRVGEMKIEDANRII